jgi:hypothetical protein
LLQVSSELSASREGVPSTVHPTSLSAAQAPQLVREIHQISERISAVEKNSVDVRFDFNDTDRLDVRIEYRQGTVHTTFRTDSSELREAISREWQGQSVAIEHRAYRMAEPNFVPSTESGQHSYASSGGEGGQRRAQDQTGAFAGMLPPSQNRSEKTTTTHSALRASVRPETSLHLHAVA